MFEINDVMIKKTQGKHQVDWRSSILFKKFNLETCNVCKTLMRESYSFSINVKVIKNVGGPNC
jgi:hypothetical protein